ncbi:hypothetical protein I4U23_015165 [Adineta vaga]|nr:hypothetical protein I4U23_015165 [Adineta vaga]
MTDAGTNFEQQQSLLSALGQQECSISSRWYQHIYSILQTRNLWIILLLVITITGIGMAFIPRYNQNREVERIDQDQRGSSKWNSNGNYAPKIYSSQKQSNSNYYNKQDRRHSPMSSFMRQKQKSNRPESVGHMNIYIKKFIEDDDDDGASLERLRFPVARYDRRQFHFKGPFTTFMPSIPIVADPFTRQTLIYASVGVYILPPLVNSYGKLYSVAELIAFGYASLVSTGVPPNSFIDMRSYYRPIPIIGKNIPTINTSTNRFTGSFHTNFGYFQTPDEIEDSNDRDYSDNYQNDRTDYRPSSYFYNRNHHRRRPSNRKGPSQTKTSSTQRSTTTSTSTIATTRAYNDGEVHLTLIIDTFRPYSTSDKPIVSANYSYPGPLIEAYENDTLIIRVINRLNVPSTMHWHGIRQINTPDMDGAVGVTQCAIPPNHELIYKFKANPVGTFWYHGHLLEQYTDGLYGPLIIRQRDQPNTLSYDSEHILMIADWYNNRAHTELLPWYINSNNPDGVEPVPDAIVVNGKFTQSLFISLSGSTKILFRIINSASFSMYTVSVDGLPLHIVEVDSTTTSPYTVSTFNINVAQRVSFYIDTNELHPMYTLSNASLTNSLFMRIQAMLSMYPVDILNYIPPYERQRYPYPTFFNPLYLLILSLDSNNSTPTYSASDATPTVTNNTTTLDTNLLDARPLHRNQNGIPVATHYLNLVIVFDLGTDGVNHPYLNNVTYTSDANYMHMRPNPKKGITSDLYQPLLHQMAEKPNELLIPLPRIEDNNQLPTIQSDKNGHYLVPYKAVVDIFLNNTDGGEHPFHLHGHNFWIIATSDYPDAGNLYLNDYLQRDTVSIPASGWAKIRFVADNPGAWFFHCHIEWHMSAGLALVFLVSPEQLLTNGYTITPEQKQLCQALKQFNTNNKMN